MIENNWRELYRAAVLELDPNKRRARMKEAEDAIRARASADFDVSGGERTAIQDAMDALRVLKRGRA
jgi:hypothetical protein